MIEGNNQRANQILVCLKDRHKQFDDLMTLTKEMDNSISSNDLDLLGAIISMRQTSMDRIDGLNLEIKNIIDCMESDEQVKVKTLLDAYAEQAMFESQVESDIHNTNQMTLLLVKKVIEVDRLLNQKIKKGD